MPPIALDATYSVGDNLSGVGVYSRGILTALATECRGQRFLWCYRAHRFLRALRETLPANCRRRLLQEPLVPRGAAVFHGLNQRLPQANLKSTLISTFHDLFVLTDEFSTSEFRRRFERQARDAAARSDLIVAVSGFTATQVQQLLGVPRARIRVVPHGVSVAPRAGTREKLVLHVGAIQKRKNIVRLVRAFEALEGGWRLVLAGSFGYGAGEALAAIESSPRRSDIEIAGYVTREKLNDLYNRASILAFPSLGEGFGIPVLEAMACGIPVLTSNGSSLAEVAGDAALLVDPCNEDEIAAGLRRLASDEALRTTLIERGSRRAQAFTWEAAARRTWACYEEAAKLV